MKKDEITRAIEEMDCLNRTEVGAMTNLIFEAIEEGTEEKIDKAAAVIEWLHKTDRITLNNYLDLRDLIF